MASLERQLPDARAATQVVVEIDGRDATGTYSENGEVPTAFEGSFSTRARDVRVSLHGGETRASGETFQTWRADPVLEGCAPLSPAPAPLPPPDKWPLGDFPGEVPRPFWEGHDDAVACWRHAWEVVGRSCLRQPEEGSGFVRDYVYTPFGSCVFMWGTCFITMFGRYASHIFPFVEMLDNFYAKQDSDGFIPRQIDIHDGRSAFEKNDLSSVGGNLLAWAEWRNYEWTGDAARLARVFPRLLAFHRWLRRNRTWKDGSYFSSGWGCGMDNIPRIDESRYSGAFDHGHLSFVDVTLQQLANARILLKIADVLDQQPGGPGIVRAATDPTLAELRDEVTRLHALANEAMWDDESGIYKDLDADGRRIATEHVGAFWSLLAGATDAAKTSRLAEAALDPRRFAAACGLASTSISDPGFVADGGNYWAGGCWCMMDYMAAKGFAAAGRPDIAHVLARRAVEAVAQVFTATGAIWESYSPTALEPGKNWGHRVRKFVGFSGTVPVALLVENVFGIRVRRGHDGQPAIDWDIRLDEPHGIEGLVLADGNRVDLRFDGAKVNVSSETPVEIRFFRNGKPMERKP